VAPDVADLAPVDIDVEVVPAPVEPEEVEEPEQAPVTSVFDEPLPADEPVAEEAWSEPPPPPPPPADLEAPAADEAWAEPPPPPPPPEDTGGEEDDTGFGGLKGPAIPVPQLEDVGENSWLDELQGQEDQAEDADSGGRSRFGRRR
jgi:hypothetical protein